MREETIPDVWTFRRVVGLSFDEVKQQLNRPYRVALAHGSDIAGGGRPRTAATAEDFEAVSTKVPLVLYMARVVIENMSATLTSQEGGASAEDDGPSDASLEEKHNG